MFTPTATKANAVPSQGRPTASKADLNTVSTAKGTISAQMQAQQAGIAARTLAG